MASKAPIISFLIIIVLALSFSSCLALKEKKLVFYMHDILTANNTTDVVTGVVVGGVKGLSSNPLKFGTLIVVDDRITDGPKPSSKTIARAKGLYSNSDLKGNSFELLCSVVFENKKYNGSTLEIQGADRFLHKEREVSVVGGTGHFRYARGYAIIETVTFEGFNAILKVTVNVRLD